MPHAYHLGRQDPRVGIADTRFLAKRNRAFDKIPLLSPLDGFWISIISFKRA